MQLSKLKYFIILLIIPIVITGHDRDNWQKPEVIMDSVGIKAGMVIGEIGAGDGYFTFKMIDRIGADGHIFANDIVQSKLDNIKQKCEDRNIKNITTILGKVDDSLLPKDSVDMVIMVYVFHDLNNPIEYLKNLRKKLKPETSVVIVERDPERYGHEYHHFFKKQKVIDHVRAADYTLVKLYTFLERDNIYIIKP
jgi:ubiquinone/menaquinone biosynthesis C-methylase UbiE